MKQRTIVRALLAVAVVASGLAVINVQPDTAQTHSSDELEHVYPVFECWTHQGDFAYTAYFGYVNANDDTVDIPIGANNLFTPSPESRGQPTEFLPGYWPRQVAVQVDAGQTSSVSWILGTELVTFLPFADEPELRCPEQVAKDAVAGITNLNWQGTWDATPEYQIDDVVSYQGSAYVAVDASEGVQPSADSDAWDLLAMRGEQGPEGPPGVSGYEQVTSDPVTLEHRGDTTGSVACPDGKVAVSGGYEFIGQTQGSNNLPQVTASYPDGEEWIVKVVLQSRGHQPELQVHATCADVGLS